MKIVFSIQKCCFYFKKIQLFWFAMTKQFKKWKKFDKETNLSQKKYVTKQTFSSSTWKKVAFLKKSNHELNSNENFVLILNFFFEYKNAIHDARNENIIKFNRFEIIQYFD